MSRNIASLRKAVNAALTVKLTKKNIELIDEKQNKAVKEGPFDGRFWFLNFENSKNSPESLHCLHSTLVSKNKKVTLGQGITNIVGNYKDKNKITEGTKVQKEGSKVLFQESSKDSFPKICDESLSADVLEEHDYAKRTLTTNKPEEEHNSTINDDNTCARSIDQPNLNQNNNETLVVLDDENKDFTKTKNLFEEVSRAKNTDISGGTSSKNIKENKGLMRHI